MLRTTCRLAAALCAIVVLAQHAAAAAPQHSMAEFGYLIGTWKCVAHIPGRAPVAYTTSFRWMYPSHAVIDQQFATKRGQADYMLSYAARTDSFVGVFVDSSGSAGFWRNP